MIEPIRNCPHCRGKAVLETSHRAFIGGKSTKVAYVRCTVCNARSGREKLTDYGRTSYSSEANERAIRAWNRRSDAIPIAWLKEQRERMIDAEQNAPEQAISYVMWLWEKEIGK